jgi:hypothetical protein
MGSGSVSMTIVEEDLLTRTAQPCGLSRPFYREFLPALAGERKTYCPPTRNEIEGMRESARILAYDLAAFDPAIANDLLTILLVALDLDRPKHANWDELREQVESFDSVRRVSQIAHIPKQEFEDYIAFFERRRDLALALIDSLSAVEEMGRD